MILSRPYYKLSAVQAKFRIRGKAGLKKQQKGFKQVTVFTFTPLESLSFCDSDFSLLTTLKMLLVLLVLTMK